MDDERAVAGGQEIRSVLRRHGSGALGTLLDREPYVSLVLYACDHQGCPLLLLSDLAEHTKNLVANPHASLLVDDTARAASTLSGQRITLQGSVERIASSLQTERFLARHPDSALYAGFKDFAFYRFTPDRAHAIAGFGKIDWHPAESFLLDAAQADVLALAEAGIVEHMNDDHADALDLYATALAGQAGSGWRMTGIDSDGFDLRSADGVARIDFELPIATAADARARLVALVHVARDKKNRAD